jgi:hypothetical protein
MISLGGRVVPGFALGEEESTTVTTTKIFAYTALPPLVGAGLGALIGNAVARRPTTGAVIGAAVGGGVIGLGYAIMGRSR